MPCGGIKESIWGRYRLDSDRPQPRHTTTKKQNRDPSSKVNFASAHLDSTVSSRTGRDSTSTWVFSPGVMGVDILFRGPGVPDKKASPPGVEITVTTIAPVQVATNFEKRLIVTTLLCESRQALEPDRSVWPRLGEEGLGVMRLRIIRFCCLYCSALSVGDNSCQVVVRTAVLSVPSKTKEKCGCRMLEVQSQPPKINMDKHASCKN